MITALSVNYSEPKSGLQRLINRFRRDRVSVEILQSGGVLLKRVRYKSYNGKVHLDRMSRAVGAERSQLLCAESIEFPLGSGFRRFNSSAFSARLCTNMAIKVLEGCKNAPRLKIGIYDTNAIACEFMLSVLEYCSDVVVVTKNSQPYFYITDRALDEMGATAVITKNSSELRECDLVIAPTTINEVLSLKPSAVILTVSKPKCYTGGTVYHLYNFRTPFEFECIKPDDLSEEYFCSALYCLGAQYGLGSIVPTSCTGGQSSQTVVSLSNYLGESADKKSKCDNAQKPA